MPQRDLYNHVEVEQTVDPEVLSEDKNGANVDAQGHESVTHVVSVGSAGDTWSASDKVELVIEHADEDPENLGDPATYEPVTDGNFLLPATDLTDGIFAALTDSSEDDEQSYVIGYRGPKRFSRVVVDFSGTHSTGTPFSAVVVKGHPHHMGGEAV